MSAGWMYEDFRILILVSILLLPHVYFYDRLSAMFILISASLVLALGFLGAFIWSVRSGQYEDDYTPSVRMLFEDPKKRSLEDSENQPIEENKP